jgi:hypothetical protein
MKPLPWASPRMIEGGRALSDRCIAGRQQAGQPRTKNPTTTTVYCVGIQWQVQATGHCIDDGWKMQVCCLGGCCHLGLWITGLSLLSRSFSSHTYKRRPECKIVCLKVTDVAVQYARLKAMTYVGFGGSDLDRIGWDS